MKQKQEGYRVMQTLVEATEDTHLTRGVMFKCRHVICDKGVLDIC